MGNIDNIVEETLEKCITDGSRKSFFLFAGAGSGKTHSLVSLLKKVKEKWGSFLKKEGRQVAVITYTNAATEEIISRLGVSPLFHVSTIHSFVWDVIQPFQVDIKKLYIKIKEEEISEIQEKLDKAKSHGVTYNKNLEKKQYLEEKIKKAETFDKFTYNPNGINNERNSLNHSDVIKLSSLLIKNNLLLQQIISQKYPFLLIDESQDTKKELIRAFFDIDKNFGDQFTLGLLGDQKQRIYTDGEEQILSLIPEKWEKPVKQMNYRCSKRIVDLANKIGGLIDEKAQQIEKEDAREGFARLFLIQSISGTDMKCIENDIASQMSSITNDPDWILSENKVKILTIEHLMAAQRLGFSVFWQEMRNVDKYSQSLLQGKVDEMDIVTKLAFPILLGDKNNALNILKQYSPLIKNLPQEQAYKALENCKTAIFKLKEMNLETTTIKAFVEHINQTNLFTVPEVLRNAISKKTEDLSEDDPQELIAWVNIMNIPVIQIKLFDDYVNNKTMFATHQGVKGLEYDRVLVIINDNESKMNIFSYNKLLGVTPPSENDKKNQSEGKETTIDRTTRLFYVVCTRAKQSLAVAMYTEDPDKAKQTAIEKQWFKENEIIIM